MGRGGTPQFLAGPGRQELTYLDLEKQFLLQQQATGLGKLSGSPGPLLLKRLAAGLHGDSTEKPGLVLGFMPKRLAVREAQAGFVNWGEHQNT